MLSGVKGSRNILSYILYFLMDPKLVNAAQLGDTTTLAELLSQDPLILNKVALSPTAETPLHIATISGQTQFARQILTLQPSFARDLNKDGFTPLHIAAATGNTEIVKDVADHEELCHLKDKFGLTPLHHAAIKGRIRVIQELVSCCPAAVKEVSMLGETALHLAVTNHQFEALKVLVENFGDDGEIMGAKDKDGNTILELAVATKQFQVLELLGFQGNVDREKIEILSGAQFENEKNITCKSPTNTNAGNSDGTQPQQTDQSTEDNSNNIKMNAEQMVLVVASLIATVTYQAGLSPPPTIWKEDMKLSSKCIFHKNNSPDNCPDIKYYFFMSFNTAGFFASALLILLFKSKSTAEVLLPVALVSMMITYVTLSVSKSPNGLSLLILYLITLSIFVYCVLAIEVVRKFIHSAFRFASERVGEVSELAFKRHKSEDISDEHA